MAVDRPLAAVALAALLVTAGCTGLATDPGSSATTTATDPNASATTTATAGEATATASGTTTAGERGVGETRAPIAVRGGSLPVNATRVFERVERVMDANVSAPAAVRVTNASAFYGTASGERAGSVTGHARFERALGLRQRANASTLRGPNGVTVDYGTIAVYPGEDPTPAGTAALLAHEFAHYVQFRRGDDAALRSALDGARTTDAAFVRRAVVEGVAVAVETAYVQRYRPTAETGIARSRRALDRLPAGSAFAHRQRAYVAGYEYAVSRYGSPTAAARSGAALAADPPATGEALLQGARETPLALSVTVDADDAGYRGGVADRLGAAYLRTALANAPDVDAADAAAGWGADRLVVLRGNGTANHAWVLRFDAAADAARTERALEALLDARGDRSAVDGDARWRLDAPENATRSADAALHRPTDRTVVLAVGTPAFVADLAVAGANGSVTLALDHSNATTARAAAQAVDSVATSPRLKPAAVVPSLMTRKKLQEASSRIAEAADAASDADAEARLREQADEFESHATAESGPDHGRLARHERILADVADDEGGEVAEKIDAAVDAIHAYRETIHGV